MQAFEDELERQKRLLYGADGTKPVLTIWEYYWELNEKVREISKKAKAQKNSQNRQ